MWKVHLIKDAIAISHSIIFCFSLSLASSVSLDQWLIPVCKDPFNSFGIKNFRSVAEKLGQERISKVKIVGPAEVEQSLYGQLVLGKGVSSGLDEMLAKEVAKAGRLAT